MRKFRIFSSFLVVVFFISFISFNPGSGHLIQLGGEVLAAGTLYNYNKYNVDTVYTPKYTFSSSYAHNSITYGDIFSNYSVDNTGVHLSGYVIHYGGYLPETGSYYSTGNTWGLWEYRGNGNNTGGNVYFIDALQISVKGILIQENIVAENGAYPDDGKYTDGYWYVKGAKVNTPPIILNNTPTQNAALFPNLQTPERSA